MTRGGAPQGEPGESRSGISRRTALRSGVALGTAAAVAGVMSRSAVADATASSAAQGGSITLTPSDLAADPAATVQAAIDQLAAGGGGTVHLPAGTYELSATLALKSNVRIVGAGQTATVLRDADDLGARPIFLALGTAQAPIRNAEVSNLTIRNGAATTGAAPTRLVKTPLSMVGKDGVYAENVDGLTIQHVSITEIQGLYGFWCKVTSNLLVSHCNFYRLTYAMLYVMSDCDTIRVEHNIFDTTVSTAYAQNYTFAMGSDVLKQGTAFAKNVWVEHNVFKNNPNWLGINSHGGENLYIRHNYCENVFGGIIVATVQGYVENPVLKNVEVAHNTFVQGTAFPYTVPRQRVGITVAGASANVRAENVRIDSNRIVGFGGGDAAYGSILVERADATTVVNNRIEDFGTFGILLGEGAFNVAIKNNTIRNMAVVAPNAGRNTAAISVQLPGAATGYGVLVEGNTIEADSPAQTPAWFVYAPNQYASWQIRANTITDVSQDVPYSVVDYLPVERTAEPKDYLVQRRGDLIYDASGAPGWVVTAPAVGYGSLDTTTVVVKATITSGSSTAIVVAGGTQNWRALPPGMNLSIAGAGSGGGPLNARVLEITSPTTVTLDTAAITSVTGADVVYQPLELAVV